MSLYFCASVELPSVQRQIKAGLTRTPVQHMFAQPDPD